MSDFSDDSILRSLLDAKALKDTLLERMGMKIERAETQITVVSMPVSGNTQPFGFLHGGASAALAETAGSIAATIYAHPRLAFGKSLSIRHRRPVKLDSGLETVTAYATLSEDRFPELVYRIEIIDDEENLVADAELTAKIVEPKTDK